MKESRILLKQFKDEKYQQNRCVNKSEKEKKTEKSESSRFIDLQFLFYYLRS